MEQKKLCVAYIRVSTQQQGDDDRFGIEAQKKAIEEYAKANNFEIAQFFIDKISGVKEERPEWNKIILADDINNPPFKAVLVYKQDRVARDIKLFFYYLYKLQIKGIELISVYDNVDDKDPLANVMRSLMVFCAEQERKNITLRTSNGRKIKALKGGYSGGRPPLGYKVIDKSLVVDEKEKETVKLIFEMFDDNCSLNSIANDLNKWKIPNRKNTSWCASQIYYIVKNRKFYQGFYRYGDKEWVKGQHEPILGE